MGRTPNHLSVFELDKWLRIRDEKPILIDVREYQELDIAPFPFEVMHLPLSESSTWLNDLFDNLPKNKDVVVICHAGIRSWNFAQWLIDKEWKREIWSLDGGIDSWSLNIDPDVPRY